MYNYGLGFNGAQIICYLLFRHIQTTKNEQNLLTNLQIYNSRAEFTRVNLICAQLNLNPDSLLTGVLFSSFPDISFNFLRFFF